MKRSILYLLIFAVILMLPTKATDVGKLRPVETIAVYTSGSVCRILTDTKDSGCGKTVASAIENLKVTTPATIYLDTARYLIVNDPALIDNLYPYLKKRVKLYQFTGEVPMDTVSEYLAVHGDGPTIKEWKNGAKLPVLNGREGRLSIA